MERITWTPGEWAELREAVLYGEHASPYIQRLREEGKLDA